jgi:hypothetical protein
MALTVVTSGTTTPTVGATSVLDTETPTVTPMLYIFEVDTAAMVNGDQLTLTIQAIVLTAGTQRIVYVGTYANIQGQPIKLSPPVPADVSIEFDLLQSAGTARAFPWKIWHL